MNESRFKFDNCCEINTTMGNILWIDKKCESCDKSITVLWIWHTRYYEDCYPEMTKIDREMQKS